MLSGIRLYRVPQGGSVSWQGHLFGAIGGVLAAWMLASADRRAPRGQLEQVTTGAR